MPAEKDRWGDWVATDYFEMPELGENRALRVETRRDSMGNLCTNFTVGKREGGFFPVAYGRGGDFEEVERFPPVRATEKAVNRQHAEQLARVDQVKPRAAAHYGVTLAPVAAEAQPSPSASTSAPAALLTHRSPDEVVAGARIRVYDCGPPQLDRYFVVYMDEPERAKGTYSGVGMSEDPFHPLGFGQHSAAMPGAHLGKRIAFESLPLDCRRVVMQDLGPAFLKGKLNELVDWLRAEYDEPADLLDPAGEKNAARAREIYAALMIVHGQDGKLHRLREGSFGRELSEIALWLETGLVDGAPRACRDMIASARDCLARDGEPAPAPEELEVEVDGGGEAPRG